MSIKLKDVGKLWGLAAGRCSYPDCNNVCVDYLDDKPTMLAEMAHIIPQSGKGPRGEGERGEDSYENFILLCPTHHTMIDKTPSKYPQETLHKWKREHEDRVALANRVRIESKKDLCTRVYAILCENKHIWVEFGPESLIAKTNFISTASRHWQIQKLKVILPNNRRIIEIMEINMSLLNATDIVAFTAFKTHALAFESSAFFVIDHVPRFPIKFEERIHAGMEFE